MSRNSSKRWPMPGLAGMPARILSSRTRRHSASANLPNRKNASRDSVAIQFGLPRPAFSICIAPAFALSFDSWIRWSLSSKGESLESAFCVARPVFSLYAGAIASLRESEIERQPAVDDPLVLRIVLLERVRAAHAELPLLAQALDEQRVDVDEPLVRLVVVRNRVLGPELQGPSLREAPRHLREDIEPAHLGRPVLAVVVAEEVAQQRVEGQLVLGHGVQQAHRGRRLIGVSAEGRIAARGEHQ